MSIARARALQSLQNGLRRGSRPALRTTFKRAQMQAKRFASSEHGHEQKSDLPWLLGALIVTPPSVYYLWPSSSDDHHGHETHGHNEEQTKLGDDEKPEEEKSGDDDEAIEEVKEEKDSSDSKDDEKADAEDKADDKSSKTGEKATPKEPAPEKEDKDDVPAEGEGEAKPAKSNGNIEGVNFKGKMKPDSDGASHSVKVESDSKGGAKKRLDSGLAKNLTPGHEQEGSSRDTNTMDGKQKGLSNTQTRHSEPIHESSEKSKKPDGTPETSKHMGTVDGDK